MAPREGSVDRLSVAVVGCGYWGTNYLRNFAENMSCRLVAVADQRPKRLAAIRAKHMSVAASTDAAVVIDDPEVEAVAIATPVSTHYELCRAALEAGKHVVVAKPLAATTVEAQDLKELAERAGLTLLVDHTFLYGAPVRKIRELLDRGDLGEPFYFDSVRVNLGLFQSDVNVIWDLAAHDLSIFMHLLQRDPRSVHAVGASHSPSELEDVAYVTLTYDDELLAHSHVNWLSPVKIRQTLVAGSEKMLVWNDLAPDEQLRIYDRGVTMSPDAEGVYRLLVDYRMGDVWMPHLERYEPLAAVVDHFVDCVRAGVTPLTDGEFGVRVVRLLEAATCSIRAGGSPVEFASLPTI
jgi:predicted dehydrogenase